MSESVWCVVCGSVSGGVDAVFGPFDTQEDAESFVIRNEDDASPMFVYQLFEER